MFFSCKTRGGVVASISFALLLTALLSGYSHAQVSVPNTFKPGAPIRSSEVNANFKALETAVNQQNKFSGATTNAPVVVDVVCTGTGSTLQSALDQLNPVAAVYEVRVSGVCNELITLQNFVRITIKSANLNTPASINGFTNSSSFYAVLEDMVIRYDGQVGQGGGECALCNFSMGRTDVFNTRVDCINSGVCTIAVNANSGEMRLYSVTKGGTWANEVRVTAGRQASLLVSWSSSNRSVCFLGTTYTARLGGIIQYAPDTEAQRALNCPAVQKLEQTGGLVIGI